MEDKPDKAVLIVGCGYIGQRVGCLLQAENHPVSACVRSKESAVTLQAQGIEAYPVDLDTGRVDAMLGEYDEIFYFVPPPREGNFDTRMAAFLRALDNSRCRRIVYISTSAVYGDCHGAWITESQPLAPTTGRGHRRLDAEQQLTAWCEVNSVQWTVLRVPGIYGPGKLPLVRLEKGLPVLQEVDSPFTNRIHADDLAAICVTAMHSEISNTVFNVSDGHPGNMTDYFFRVADAAGLPRPPTVTRAEAGNVLSAGMLSFLNDSRRMDNTKMLRQLDIKLQYPNLQAGLKSCFTV